MNLYFKLFHASSLKIHFNIILPNQQVYILSENC